MADLIKTWPAIVGAREVARIFSAEAPPLARYYFTLGRGKPSQAVSRIWLTWSGRILGWFWVESIARNDGSLPRLRSLSDQESEWQIKPDNWVAICKPPCTRLRERLYMSSFRGWRYFDVDSYRGTPEARVRV